MRIIPAIDIIGGKCVRLTKGEYTSMKIYNEDPVEVARMFQDNGIRYLHLVDLYAAKDNKNANRKIINKITSLTSLKIDFGGGIKSDEDIISVFESGATQVNIGTTAATDQELFLKWLSYFGPGKIILGADCKDRKIHISGWLNKTDIDICDYIHDYVLKGVSYSVCTDISKDGTLSGPAVDLYKEILHDTSLNLIASGGISSVRDIEDVQNAGCEGVIIGKAIYEGKITMKELSRLC
jgi:phosphoribosylformimino-5-aminoimidazole carboxamide ribotide isomerase